ncbi:MAG TPA: serine hydrolase [Roseiflexaceae bacterium]|nr:serine hydrolase [Roseiflexaceae bacterium]
MQPTSSNPGSTQSAPSHPPYMPGLDGLRAVAVIAVLLYHAGLPLTGGYLGVETFFVLSGFLITGLLLAEWRHNGQIDLMAFWRRRARRLLPALLLMLTTTVCFTILVWPAELPELLADSAASLAYLMNWHLITGQRSYFDPMLQPPLLQHLWSLAVEEQFYIVWPLLFLFGMRFLRPRGMLLATLVGAALSAALMFVLYDPGADPSRIYYGTDTRAAGLLLGAALAFVWQPSSASATGSRQYHPLLDGIGLLALGILGVAYLWMYEQHPLLYRGGFVLVASATIIVIIAATASHTRLMPWLLGGRILRWIGIRSYGIYLWHWPIFILMRPIANHTIDTWPIQLLQFSLVAVLAELSFRFVETPIRHGGLAALLPVLRSTPPAITRRSYVRIRPTGDQPLRFSHPQRRQSTLAFLSALLLFSAACVAPSTPVVPTTIPTEIITALPTGGVEPTDTVTPIPPSVTPIPPSPTPPPPSPTATPTDTPLPEPTAVVLEPFDPALAAELQRVLDQHVADGSIPGAVAAVHFPGREPWLGASGVADQQQALPMTPDTRVRIASISKVFTAAVVLLLVEEGTIDLDASIDRWVPDLVPAGDTITVRMLLQHTSGLYDYLEDRNYVAEAYRTGDRMFAPAELVTYAARFPLAFAPGSPGDWDYSSTNYVLLGLIVEAATGNSLASEMRSRIFEPLQLDSTYFVPDEVVAPPVSRGYSRGTDQTNTSMSFAFATANLVSTAGDVQRFGAALFGGDLLAAESLAQMLTVVNGKGQYNMPELEYGLGVMRNRLPVSGAGEASRVFGHIGGFGGFRSALWHAPESGVTVALGVNQAATDPNLLAIKLYDTILRYQE